MMVDILLIPESVGGVHDMHQPRHPSWNSLLTDIHTPVDSKLVY